MRFLFGSVALWVMAAALSAQATPGDASCKAVGRPQFIAGVPEASGIAQAAGAWWTHNDSGAPALFRLDGAARPTPVSVDGIRVQDWEDLASGPCTAAKAAERCLYLADIGDNRGSRDHITIYEIPAPRPGSTSTKPAAAIHAKYPDYPHDAEALVMSRAIGTFIITKEMPARVYRLAVSKSGETNTLALVRTLNEKVRITGGAVSPDERWVALRSNKMLFVYAANDFANGGNPVRIDLTGFKEPQGEGIAFGSGGELFLISEGGGGDAAGVLTRIHCALIR